MGDVQIFSWKRQKKSCLCNMFSHISFYRLLSLQYKQRHAVIILGFTVLWFGIMVMHLALLCGSWHNVMSIPGWMIFWWNIIWHLRSQHSLLHRFSMVDKPCLRSQRQYDTVDFVLKKCRHSSHFVITTLCCRLLNHDCGTARTDWLTVILFFYRPGSELLVTLAVSWSH